jgi:hypothetical protein
VVRGFAAGGVGSASAHFQAARGLLLVPLRSGDARERETERQRKRENGRVPRCAAVAVRAQI